jgi:hypothetical protein
MCELTRKFIWTVGRLRPDHPGEFVGFSDLFEPRSGADKSLDTFAPRSGANIFIMNSIRFYRKSLIFLIPQEKPVKLKNINISHDINIIALISNRLIMFVSIHFLTIRRIMDLIQKYSKQL